MTPVNQVHVTLSNVIMNSLQTALRIARHEGATRAAGYLLRPRRQPNSNPPDEVGIVFDALRGATAQGTMIDVGAHHGTSLRDFLRMGWQVFAFEPDPNNREKLLARFGTYPELQVDPRALSNQAAESAPLFASDQSTGISSLNAFHETHYAATSVELTTLSNFIKTESVLQTGIDFLKIDTEGHDLMVLQGIPWKEVHPRVIVCEFEDKKTHPLGYSFSDLADHLVSQGYDVIVSEWYPIIQYGTDHKWRCFDRYPCALNDEHAWGNLIATRDDDVLGRLKLACKLD